ncbi:MAG: NnrS family protein [Pseudomonadota bacterium]
MITSAEQMRAYTGPVLFSFGFRPFFLCGAVLAWFAPMLTALAYSGAIDLRGFDVNAFHSHEMTYGYLSAVIAGFLLTAVPNWTGRLPVCGWRLAILFLIWLAGRAAFLMSGQIGPLATAIVDLGFLALLTAFVWREILKGKNWRNVPVGVLLTLFFLGNILWHVGRNGVGEPVFGVRFGIAVAAMLIALIGGRIGPSFTRNWLKKTGRKDLPPTAKPVELVALGAAAIGLAAWVMAPLSAGTGALLLVAGVLHSVRLSRWHGWRTFAEPLVTILHVGYLWLPISFFLMGSAALWPALVPQSAALHALTAGSIGVMTLAVMTRATRGHTGRALSADRATFVIYALAILGAAGRVLAPFAGAQAPVFYVSSALLWSGAFGLFAVVYGQYLLSSRLVAR